MVSMADNRGVAPPDPSTNIGKMRFALGDSAFVPLDPPEPGYGNYQLFSDDELATFLILADDNVARAIAMAYRQIGASWASTGATIKTDDLSYSAKDSVGNWLSLADYWDKVADDQDQRAVDSLFDMVEVGTTRRGRCKPEAAPWPWPCPHSLTRACGKCSW